MRIISGIYKSRILYSPDSTKVRPTSDRAKETLFNMLENRMEFDGITCIDLFCGTGNLGLECISRGAANCYFVDLNTDLVNKNIVKLDAENKSEVFKMKAISFLNKFTEIKADIIFCDPPYLYNKYDKLLSKILPIKTICILEHSEKFLLSSEFEKFVFLRKNIGTINFTFFDFNKS
ncbi:MAG: RsmD family RNA methyltransferase [Ignavibacteria bacterium]